jgi:hypothetical protein
MARRELLLAVLACGGLPSLASAQFVPGDLYISAYDRIYHVDVTDWTFSVFADASDGLADSAGMEFSPSGTLLCTNYDSNELFEFDAAGSASVLLSSVDGLSGPTAVGYDVIGNLLVLNDLSNQALSFPVGGGPANVLADSGDGILSPGSVAVDSSGSVLIGDFYPQSIWTIDTSGTVTAFDTTPEPPMTIAIRNNGDVYLSAGTLKGITVYRYPSADATLRYALASFPSLEGWGAVQLSLDQKTLYFATGDSLYTIDADSGVSAEVIDKSKGLFNSWSISVYGKYFKAALAGYGNGLAGTYGSPALSPQGDPIVGTAVTIDLSNSAGVPTVGLLFIGLQRCDLPTGFGGNLVVLPIVTIPITVPAAGMSFSGNLPDDPRLAGTTIDLQAVEADAGAVKGVSFSQGLELSLGY